MSDPSITPEPSDNELLAIYNETPVVKYSDNWHATSLRSVFLAGVATVSREQLIELDIATVKAEYPDTDWSNYTPDADSLAFIDALIASGLFPDRAEDNNDTEPIPKEDKEMTDRIHIPSMADADCWCNPTIKHVPGRKGGSPLSKGAELYQHFPAPENAPTGSAGTSSNEANRG